MFYKRFLSPSIEVRFMNDIEDYNCGNGKYPILIIKYIYMKCKSTMIIKLFILAYKTIYLI